MKKFFEMRLKLILILSLLLSFFSINCVYADEGATSLEGTLGEITRILAAIAGVACVIKLVQIGMMYALTGANDKSTAKTAVVPWIVGAIICGGYAFLGNAIITTIGNAAGYNIEDGKITEGQGVLNPVDDPEEVVIGIGEIVFGAITIVAAATVVGMLIFIGIKYMLSGAQEVAKVKTTIIPWLVGAIIIGGASGLTQIVMSVINSSSTG